MDSCVFFFGNPSLDNGVVPSPYVRRGRVLYAVGVPSHTSARNVLHPHVALSVSIMYSPSSIIQVSCVLSVLTSPSSGWLYAFFAKMHCAMGSFVEAAPMQGRELSW